MKKIDEIRNYLIEEINQNGLKSKEHKNVCKVLNYTEHSLIIISAITEYVSISTFTYLVGTPIGITSCAIWFEVCLITTEIKKFKSTKKKKEISLVIQ